MPRTTPLLPLATRRALAALGTDLQRARKRRRLTAAMVAERARISRPTLLRVERGDPGDVARVLRDWRSVAAQCGIGRSEVDRMATAFEHDDALSAR